MKVLRKYGILALLLLVGSFSFSLSAKNEGAKASSKYPAGKVMEINKDEFVKRVFDFEHDQEWKYKGDKPCILDFYASWCGPCKKLSPHLDEVAAEYKDKIYIYKINVDVDRDLAAAFGASSIPLVIFIPKEGTPAAARGYLPKEEVENAVETVLHIKK
ncbi:MAG: thioredoxin fold domain-containing protein [Paludibacteraceae bacterium]|nr:thioredoxin fold domain-containing protein [Paludibacteraceae bacterium]MBR4841021.1 thioredoxin fold domain-containing protein [Paludibacteraceae bacterium]